MSFKKIKASLLGNKNSVREHALALDCLYNVEAEKLMKSYHTLHFNGMDEETRFFKSDAVVHRCVTIIAGYAISTVGFDTKLESPIPLSEEEMVRFEAKYAHVKAYVNSVNKLVNFDDVLFSTCINMMLYGKAAFEIVREVESKSIVKLVKLPTYNSTEKGLQPIVERGELKRFVLRIKEKQGVLDTAKEVKFARSKVLYFVNNDIDADWQGISDMQMLVSNCIIRAELDRNIPQVLRRIHDPYVMASVDTSGNMFYSTTAEGQKEELQNQLKSLLEGFDSGSNVVTNNKVTATVMQLKIDLPGLIAFDREREDKIIAHFGVPRFLVNRPDVNRATAESEFTAFVSGTVATRQRRLKRVIERDWYDMLVRQCLGLSEDEDLPVLVKHVWRQSETGNLKEKAEVANMLFDKGYGLLGGNPELVVQLAGLYNDKVSEWFKLLKQEQEEIDLKRQTDKQ